jgi:electron transfer flavoprotein beta subunit
MKIAVCVNYVPDTETRVKIAADGKTIDRTGVNFMLAPYDEIAVEEALRMREKFTGEVAVLSLGNDKHKEALRKALAMGADKAILVKDDKERDSYGVAVGLAAALKPLAPDVILFGKQSIDYDDGQVGTLIAEMLDMPSVNVAVKITIDGAKAECVREIEGGHEIVEVTLPAVFMAQKGLNDPRYPSLKGIMAAKNKPIEEVAAAQADRQVETLAMRKPPAKAAGRILGTDKTAVAELVRLLHQEAKII